MNQSGVYRKPRERRILPQDWASCETRLPPLANGGPCGNRTHRAEILQGSPGFLAHSPKLEHPARIERAWPTFKASVGYQQPTDVWPGVRSRYSSACCVTCNRRGQTAYDADERFCRRRTLENHTRFELVWVVRETTGIPRRLMVHDSEGIAGKHAG